MITFNVCGDWKNHGYAVKTTLKKILAEVCVEENITTRHVISFIFVNNEEIHEINKKYRNIDRPTDVISFAEIDGNQNRELGYELGDIFINYDRVVSQAKDYGHSTLREFSFLATHGTLHLLGYDHMKKEDEEVMFAKQDKILSSIGITR
jgi:probable rRNA maturation factor